MQAVPPTERTPAPNGVNYPTPTDRHESRFVEALAAWDNHMARCGECLAFGLHLCNEGGYLADEITLLRARRDGALAQAKLRLDTTALGAHRAKSHRVVPVPAPESLGASPA